MRDIKSFTKLFDLNIPNYEHFDYYISQYSKLDRWKNMNELINLYNDAENKIENIYKYKLEKVDEIINFVKSKRAYEDLSTDTLLPDLPTSKNMVYDEDIIYLSIDMIKANWQVVKDYDPPFLNELGDTYTDFLNKFDLHPIFHHSKHFRQFIFGNLNPKRQIKAQRKVMETVLNYIPNEYKLECIKNDEVIYSLTKKQLSTIENVLSGLDKTRFSFKIFDITKKDDFRINNYMDFNGTYLHSEMMGCNGLKYFIFLKKYILKEKLSIKDLYFNIDGDIAVWNVENLKLEI